MTATTPIYGLSYPEATDLVSTAPDSFKSMADTFEKALDQVDRRATPEGVKPVIATTLATLVQTTGITGQIGYVTTDTTESNIGAYVYTGTAWQKLSLRDDCEAGTAKGVSLSVNGAASIDFSHTHKTPPKAVVVTRVKADAADLDERLILFHPIVWSVTADNFQARFYRLDTKAWLNSWIVSFSWIAVW